MMFMRLKDSDQAKELLDKRRKMCESIMNTCQETAEEIIAVEEEKDK